MESTNNLRKSNNNPLTNTANFSTALTTSQYKSSLQGTGRIDSGAKEIYFSADAPMVNIDRSSPKVTVGTATGQTQSSTGTGELNIPKLPYGFPVTGHIVPGFKHTLKGVGPLCDADCTFTFTYAAVIVWDSKGSPVITGWREKSGLCLWRIALQPGKSNLPNMPHDANRTTFKVYSAYDLPSVRALICYFHAAAGYPVRSTWLKAIGAGNYSTWPGLTLANATKYCLSATATILGHLVQKRQGVRSTKTKAPTTIPQEHVLPQVRSNELHIHVTPISKLYTDDTGRFPVHARSGNRYIMISYHCNANLILAEPFSSRKDAHKLLAYNKIMQKITDNKLSVDLQIIDNESSAEYKRSIKTKRNAKYKLLPLHTHRSNAAERAIRMFKSHFLSILAGVAPDFPRNIWDLLLPQAELTLNLLRQATLDPSQSAWS